nr:hypothetical protein [Candidatus Woesearchaeota archaeon]
MTFPIEWCQALIVVGLIIIALKIDKKITVKLKDIPYVEQISGYLGLILFAIGLLLTLSGNCV